MGKDLISIIVPIYNVAECLSRCIESLMAQTYENIEILLINDGSPDNSGEICEKYAAMDSRVKHFPKENGGLSHARNYGIEHAKGKYLCFVDGDDFMDRRMVETLYHDIVSYGVNISTCGFRVYHDGDPLVEEPVVEENIEKFTTEEAINHLFTKEKYANYAWNKMYLASLFDEVRFPVGRKMEDLGTMYKLMGQCEAVTYNPVKLCNYYQRGTSILHNRDKKFYEDKFFLTYERYCYLKERFPNMIRNELYMMVVIMDAYPHMENGSQDQKLAESLMEQFPTTHMEHFPPRYVRRYQYYRFNKAMYAEIYSKKTDKQ